MHGPETQQSEAVPALSAARIPISLPAMQTGSILPAPSGTTETGDLDARRRAFATFALEQIIGALLRAEARGDAGRPTP